MVDERAGGWTFFTSHARVLMTVARNPAVRIRDIAVACRITERTAQGIVADLDRDGLRPGAGGADAGDRALP
ncbi:MarR family transcriptional regulator, partial [Streptomyces sp. 900105245]